MNLFPGIEKASAKIPESSVDAKIDDSKNSLEKDCSDLKINRGKGSPPKIHTQEPIIYGSDKRTVDGQWVRKNVGDRVTVKAEYKPEFQGCDADYEVHSENLVIIKNEPIENWSHFSSDTSDRSTLNIKEEPLDIYHENVSQDFNNSETKELYIEEINSNIVKKEENENIKCDNTITSDDDEENHLQNDSVKPIEKRHYCPHCEKSYKNKCHLSRHVNYECLMRVSKKPKYQCTDCHIHFKTKYTMERHYATKHLKNGERSSCNACRKTFRDQKTLNRHLIHCPHNGTATITLTCKNCNKEYRHATSVWRHMRYECEKVPRFGCAHCDYMTLQKGNIVKHFRRKHADEDERTKYSCSKCKRIYKNEFTLKRHVNFECGKEPAFSCELCKFKTKRKFSLDMHVKHRH